MTHQHDDNPGTEVPFAPSFVHRLHFTRDVLGADQGILAQVLEKSGDRPAKVQFWVDEHVARALPDLKAKLRNFAKTHSNQIERAGNVQVAPGGEAVKNDIHILERMLKVFHAAGLDRRSYVVVIGGGAVLDAVGFAAAIAHRGIRLVRLPSTTLGQADSGVGVKNAVNLFGKKNWRRIIPPSPLGGDQRRELARKPARPRLHLRVLRGGEGLAPEGAGDVRRALPDGRARSEGARARRRPCP